MDEGALSLGIASYALIAGDQALVYDCHLSPDRARVIRDTLEDCVTWVSEPENLPRHLPDLARMAGLGARAILPNHGAEEIIAKGGYGPGLIEATSSYVAGLISGQLSPDLVTAIEGPVRAGDLQFFAAYQEVHRHNLAKVANLRAAEGA